MTRWCHPLIGNYNLYLQFKFSISSWLKGNESLWKFFIDNNRLDTNITLIGICFSFRFALPVIVCIISVDFGVFVFFFAIILLQNICTNWLVAGISISFWDDDIMDKVGLNSNPHIQHRVCFINNIRIYAHTYICIIYRYSYHTDVIIFYNACFCLSSVF